MYARINGEFLEKDKLKANEECIAELGAEDAGKDLLWGDLIDQIQDFEVTETGISVDMENELGYFSIEIPVDTDALIHLIDNHVINN